MKDIVTPDKRVGHLKNAFVTGDKVSENVTTFDSYGSKTLI